MIQGTEGQDETFQPQTNSRWKKYLVSGVILAVITGLSASALTQWYSGIRSIETETLLMAQVFRGELIRDIAVSGKLIAANAPQLYSPEAGQITLFAKPGDQVEKADLIARLESPKLEALVNQENSLLDKLKIDARRGELSDSEAQLDLEKSLDAARVRLNADKREHKRAELSYQKKVISELDFVKRQDTLLEAELFYQHALKRVELAKKRLVFENQTRQFAVKRQALILQELTRRQGELNILAPVSGVVGNWQVKQKERVADAQALMTIVDLSQYEAELGVPEFYADDLGHGLKVYMTIAGKELVGVVNSVSPEIINNEVKVRINIPANKNIKLRQNQRLSARIEFEKKNEVLMIKRGAFLKSTAGKSAFFVKGEIANRQPVQTGIASVEFVELISGAKEGDTLIISSYQDFETAEQIKLIQ